MATIFATYNENVQKEESTVLRLQTISNLYGISVELPYRLNMHSKMLHHETQNRISRAAFFICVLLSPPTETVKREINFALEKGIPIVVIFDQVRGQYLSFPSNAKVFQAGIDLVHNNQDKVLNDVVNFLRTNIDKKNSESMVKTGAAILGVVLGLILLNNLTSDNDETGDY